MRRTLAATRLVASVAALTAVALRTDFGSLAEVVRGASPCWVLGALAVNIVAVGGSVFLWRAMMHQAYAPSRWFLLRAYFAGMFVNNVGLGTVMGDSLRSIELAQHQNVPARRAAASVLAERMLSLIALCALASFGAAFVANTHAGLAFLVWGATGAIAVCLVVLYVGGRHLERAVLLPRTALVFGLEMHGALVELARSPARMSRGMLLALGVQLCTVLAAMLVTRSLGASLGSWQAVTVVPMIALLVQLPVSVQGIGVREGSYVLLFGAVGLSPEVAVSAALISYATTVLVSMVGGLVLLERLFSRRDSASDGREELTGLQRVAHRASEC